VNLSVTAARISDLLRRLTPRDPSGNSFAVGAVSRTGGGSSCGTGGAAGRLRNGGSSCGTEGAAGKLLDGGGSCRTEESGAGGFDGWGTSFAGGARFLADELESVAPDLAGLTCRFMDSRLGPMRVGGTSNSSRAGLASEAGTGEGLVSCAQTDCAPTADTTANRIAARLAYVVIGGCLCMTCIEGRAPKWRAASIGFTYNGLSAVHNHADTTIDGILRVFRIDRLA
jgi:hypothetical protein